MGRPRNTIPTVGVKVWLPAALHSRTELFLFSEAEGKVPHGAWQKFLSERLTDFFRHTSLDLATVAPAAMQIPPSTFYVRGSAEALELLKGILK